MKNPVWNNFFRDWNQSEENEAYKTLEQIPIFSQLSAEELKEVNKLMHSRFYRKDEYIFRQNAPGVGMYIIQEGKVSIEIEDPENPNLLLAQMQDGDFFGELTILDEKPRSAAAIATTDAKILGFFRPDLMSLLKRKPRLGSKILFNLAKVVAGRLQKTYENLKVLQNEQQPS